MQGESHIMSHLNHIGTSDIANHQTSDQAQARPGVQDKGVGHLLKQNCANPWPRLMDICTF